jgi:hypothetical protein
MELTNVKIASSTDVEDAEIKKFAQLLQDIFNAEDQDDQ